MPLIYKAKGHLGSMPTLWRHWQWHAMWHVTIHGDARWAHDDEIEPHLTLVTYPLAHTHAYVRAWAFYQIKCGGGEDLARARVRLLITQRIHTLSVRVEVTIVSLTQIENRKLKGKITHQSRCTSQVFVGLSGIYCKAKDTLQRKSISIYDIIIHNARRTGAILSKIL